MTALDKFIRLESIGYWRENANADTIEVIVSFGDSTLQLTSLSDAPITHWALLATKRIKTEGKSVIYSADSAADEILAIDDPDMIKAIAKVTREIGLARQPRRNIGKYFWLAMLSIFLVLLSQSPPLIYTWATKLTSPLRLQVFSEKMQNQLFANSDFACTDIRASHALVKFSRGMFDTYPPRIFVVKTTRLQSSGLDNTLIYLPLDTVLAAKNPETLAAEIAVNYAMSDRRALLYQALESAGPLAAIQHIFGKNIVPRLPFTNARPNADDFVAARNRLQKLRIDTIPLQELAAQNGFGLPLNNASPTEAFELESFAALQQYCPI